MSAPQMNIIDIAIALSALRETVTQTFDNLYPTISAPVVNDNQIYDIMYGADFYIQGAVFKFTTASTTLTWTAGTITRDGTTRTLDAGSLTTAQDCYIVAAIVAGKWSLSKVARSGGLPVISFVDAFILGITSAAPLASGNYVMYLRQVNSVEIEGAMIKDATIENAKITGTLTADRIVTLNGTVAIDAGVWSLIGLGRRSTQDRLFLYERMGGF